MVLAQQLTIRNRRIKKANVPRKFQFASLSAEFNSQFHDLPWQNVFLTGKSGVGKTHLMCAILNECLEQQVTKPGTPKGNLLFASVPEMLLDIRDCFRDDAELSEREVIEKYTRPDWLFLDDLGVEKTSEWVLQTLYLIIDRRYREEKGIVISSNYSVGQIADRLDDRLASRIAEMCTVVTMTGGDRRLTI